MDPNACKLWIDEATSYVLYRKRSSHSKTADIKGLSLSRTSDTAIVTSPGHTSRDINLRSKLQQTRSSSRSYTLTLTNKMAQAGPSQPSKLKKSKQKKINVKPKKLKKLSEAQAVEALEQAALQFVRTILRTVRLVDTHSLTQF